MRRSGSGTSAPAGLRDRDAGAGSRGVLPGGRVLSAGAAVMLAGSLFGACTATPAAAPPPHRVTTRNCAYSNHSIARLASFSRLIGYPTNCAVVFNDTTTTWTSWQSPWFTSQHDPDLNWAAWVRADKRRRLVITQNLFPTSQNGTDWLTAGASGAFDGHARSLATNLVKAGLGHSWIRLAHEANGTWYPDSVPSDSTGQAKWRAFWARTVRAMRSVPGAHFGFVWDVNYRVRALSLADFYPGDDVVDVIGLDAYDSQLTGRQNRYRRLQDQPGGIATVLAFAQAHHKPFAVPEWGLMPSATSDRGGDNDPGYIDGIAKLVAGNDVAFQGYFFAHSYATLLGRSSASLTRMRAHFGAAGDAASG